MNAFLGAAANSVGKAMPTVPYRGTVEPANSAATYRHSELTVAE